MDKGSRKLALPISMLVLGVFAVGQGLQALANWVDLALGSQTYFALSAAGGISLLTCGTRVLFSRALVPGASLLGAISSLVLFMNQAIGLWLNTMLCFGPG